MLSWIITISALSLAYLYFRFSIRHFRKVNEMFPGPTMFPILGNALQFMWHRRDLVNYGTENVWFYRRSFRIWLLNTLMIVITSPRDVEKIFGNMDNIDKADTYVYLLDWIGSGLLTTTGAKWRKHRKILTPAFHFNILEDFIETFHSNGVILLRKLSEKVGKGNFDCYQTIKLYALDNIAEAAMGTKVNAQIYPDGEYVKSIKVMCDIVMSRMLSPWLWPDFLFKLSPQGRRQKVALKCIHGLTNEVIARRKEEMVLERHDDIDSDNGMNIRKKRVFMDILLRTSEEGGLTDEEIRDEVNTFMFEGHDTVTSAISFALYCLAENPICQDRAYSEVREIFGESDRSETYKDLQSMKYLEMVIKETLRLYPSVPMMGRKINEDVVLDDRATLPKGCQVIAIIPVLHQWREAWDSGLEFRPENFEHEEISKQHNFQYIPFSAGPRNCIGMRFAMLEMKSALSKILRNFRLLPADPPVPLNIVVDLITISDTGINIRIEPRKGDHVE